MQARRRELLEVRLFGHAEVTLGGAPFALATPRKSLQVLAYLLLHRSAPVARDYLAFLLYPDDEESAARAKLRATLSELPKILPQPASAYVTIDTDKVAWNRDAELWLDVDAFVEAAADQNRLDEAIELYRGDLVPEIYDEWLDAIRERHRNTYLRCLSERVSRARRAADLGLAIETARKVLVVDPWREDMVRRIIAMRYESGDRAGALSEYGAFAKRLREEMSAEPMPETASVVERITRGEALPAESEGLPRTQVARPAILPFVGRLSVVDVLLQTWDGVARGRGAGAFVAGESGIGKSRLALELAHAVEERGGNALIGITGSPEAVPYECIADALRSALPLLAALKPSVALACVAALVPEIRSRVVLPQPPRLDADAERIRLFESLFRCIAELARMRPLLVVLEDLHWSQTATLDVVAFLLRRAVESRVMIVVTYRDEDTPRLHPLRHVRNDVRAASGAQTLSLGGLTISDVEQLRAACPEISDRPTEALMSASHGNPLFLAQLVVDAREGAHISTMPTLKDVVTRRIDRLSDRARTAAEIAACMGERFSRDAVREVSAWDDTELNDALDELLDRRIVREAPGRGMFEYAFTHHAVLEAIASNMPEGRAVGRRRRLGRVLEELYPERATEMAASIGRLYDLGGDGANAARCYLAAARHAIAVGALEEARGLCDRGLDLVTDQRVRVDLLRECVSVESRRGNRERWDEALTALERAGAELEDPANHRSSVLLRIEFAHTFHDRDAHRQAVEALRACTPGDDVRAMGELHLAEAQLAFACDRLAESSALAEKALECSRAADDEVGAARAMCSLAEVEVHRARFSYAAALFERAGASAARTNDWKLEQMSWNSEWMLAYKSRDVKRCVAVAELALRRAVELGDRPQEAHARSRLGISLAAIGQRYVDARAHFAAAIDILTSNGDDVATAGPLLNLAVLESRLGFFDRAVEFNERATKQFRSDGNVRGEVTGLENSILLGALAGRIDGAREAAGKALDLARDLGMTLTEASVQENLAFAEAKAGNLSQAARLAEATLELRAQYESEVWSTKTLADVAIWQAILGNMSAARESVGRLLADHDAIVYGTEWPQYCYWAAAQVLHADGQAREARAALERARSFISTTAAELEPEDREQFLAIPWHADIAGAAERDAWPAPPTF